MTEVSLEQAMAIALGHHHAGRLAEAETVYRRVLERVPEHADALNLLGTLACQAGHHRAAIELIGRAVAANPNIARYHANLAVALSEAGRRDEALEACRRALALHPEYAEAHYNLGSLLWKAGQFDDAADALEQAIALRPGLAEAHCNLGNVYKDQGRLDEALAAYRRAADANPDSLEAASNLAFNLLYHPDHDAASILAAHRAWAERFAAPLAAEVRPHRNARLPERRLKVGILSGDLRVHPVGFSLVPLLEHRDSRAIEIVGYSDVRAPDVVTARLRSLAAAWRETRSLPDHQLAELIHTDGVDILIDPSLHTAGNRLLVLARQPAPVQLTMLGPPATTGLATIGYRLTDPYLDPPGTGCDADYTERSIRLPHCFWVYLPPEEAPDVVAPPALDRGHVTFGCLNQPFKMSAPAQRLWAEVLRRVPGARLVMQAHPGRHREPIRARFREQGIDPDRIEFVPQVPRRDYFRRYQEVDISLDPFPYNAHTSAMDSLWMGVPVVTLAGRTAVGRGGVTILTNAGLPELIARTPDEYVETAVALASDIERLTSLHSSLRQRMLASPLCDGPLFAADVAAALRRIWREWCQP
jgi:predicted O-linked N-acetylglucosamine transferase (SPINDLY family)